MKIAIISRLESYPSEKPFDKRFYIDLSFKEIFDKLNIMLIPVFSLKNLEEICKLCDALILPGRFSGVDPKYYNDVPYPGKSYDYDEYILDKEVLDMFVKYKKPILGICGGMQTLNVYFGGDLNQNISNHKLGDGQMHHINIEKQSFLYDVYQNPKVFVNSFHRQAVRKLAPNFKVTAMSEDGIIEAIEYDNIVAVQWHPEVLNDIHFFEMFVNRFLK